jgi:hypothetical protein
MSVVEDDLHASAPADSASARAEDLIPEVRQHTRRRRFRNLAIILVAAALAAGLVVVIGSGSSAHHLTGKSGSPGSAASARGNSSTVVPKQPVSLAVGPTGVLYVGDEGRQQILRRTAGGRFRVVAGTGVAGYSGDGRLATQAKIDAPYSLAIAPSGVLYFLQAGRKKNGYGTPDGVVREISPDGTITTVIGRDPNCGAAPSTAASMPAQSAEFDGAQLTIASDGALDIAATVCPNVLRLSRYLQLTSTGMLVRSSWGFSIPKWISELCGAGVEGRGFVAFACASGAGRSSGLVVARSNGTVKNYPDVGSQTNPMASSGGVVVAFHNRAVVRVQANGLHTISSPRQLIDMVPGATGSWSGDGIAIDRRRDVYIDQDFLIAHHGCAGAIFEIGSSGRRRSLWRSAPINSCY